MNSDHYFSISKNRSLLVSINVHSSSAEVKQWSKHSSNSCSWSKFVGGHDTFAIDGDIAKKRWDHCTEMRPEVLSCEAIFPSLREKNVPQSFTP